MPGEDVNDDVEIFGAYAQYTWIEGHVIEPFFLRRSAAYDTVPAGEVAFKDWTFGLRVAGALYGFDYEAEALYEIGDRDPILPETRDIDIRAFGFAAMVGYTFSSVPWTPRVALEYTFGSGDKDPTDGKSESFSPAFPGAHIFLGFADQAAWRNIEAWKLIIQGKPAPNLTLEIDLFKFKLDENTDAWFNFVQAPIRPGNASADDDLGIEVDVHAKWVVAERLTVWGGWAHFRPGGFVEDTAPSTDKSMDWVFLQIQLDF